MTDREQAKAVLVPIRDESVIARGIEEGWLKPGEDTPIETVRRERARRTVADILREDRDGR
jgi:hypothetical protein